jgi:hypothetical protein
VSWYATFANRSTATGSCNPTIIPPAEQWSPTNPNGITCDPDEQIVSQLGVDPATGFPDSPLDNVGMQYGPAALDSGAITSAQFATLNPDIGGMNFVGVQVPQRTEASLTALRAVYADDLVNSAVPRAAHDAVIDQRLDLDFFGFGYGIHTTDWSFIIRADARRQRDRRQPGQHREHADGDGDQRGRHLRAGRDGRLADEHRERSLAPQRSRRCSTTSRLG